MSYEDFTSEAEAQARCEELKAQGRCAYVLQFNAGQYQVRHWY